MTAPSPSGDEPEGIERRTGELFGGLWDAYDDALFKESVELFERRWRANGERLDFFEGKRCLDAGCGGGRYSLALALMGAREVVGVDVGEAGLEDARRRAAGVGAQERVSFVTGSVLELPVEDAAFDFVCCSGVLHHTPSVARGLAECRRVLRPGGSLYLLLYGDGGLYWPLNAACRPYADVLGADEVERCVAAAGMAANKRRTILDDLFVPILETYAPERVDRLLEEPGFTSWRPWTRGRGDHESDPATLLSELRQREALWRAGAETADDPDTGRLEAHLADLCASTVAAGELVVEAGAAGELSAEAVHAAVIGTGHHRIVATVPGG